MVKETMSRAVRMGENPQITEVFKKNHRKILTARTPKPYDKMGKGLRETFLKTHENTQHHCHQENINASPNELPHPPPPAWISDYRDDER